MAGMRRFALMFSAATASFAFHLGQHAVRNVVILEVSRTAYEGAGCVRARVVPMLASSGGRGFDVGSIPRLPGPMEEGGDGDAGEEVGDSASTDVCRVDFFNTATLGQGYGGMLPRNGGQSGVNIGKALTTSARGRGFPGNARGPTPAVCPAKTVATGGDLSDGMLANAYGNQVEDIKNFHLEDGDGEVGMALNPFIVSTALEPLVLRSALVPFIPSDDDETSRIAVETTPTRCGGVAPVTNSDDGTHTVFYCSAKLGGLSSLCVAGAASRELVTTTASEAVSHAALWESRYSSSLCFPTTAVDDHEPPAVVRSMPMTVAAERSLQPWPDTALVAQSVSGEDYDLSTSAFSSVQVASFGVTGVVGPPSLASVLVEIHLFWFQLNSKSGALSEAVAPFVFTAGGLVACAWFLLYRKTAASSALSTRWWALVCLTLASALGDGLFTPESWLATLSLAKILVAIVWLSARSLFQLAGIVGQALADWIAVTAGVVMLAAGVITLGAASSIWVAITAELGLEEEHEVKLFSTTSFPWVQSQPLLPPTPTPEDDKAKKMAANPKETAANPVCAQKKTTKKAEKKARRKAKRQERRARGVGLHISAVRC